MLSLFKDSHTLCLRVFFLLEMIKNLILPVNVIYIKVSSMDLEK